MCELLIFNIDPDPNRCKGVIPGWVMTQIYEWSSFCMRSIIRGKINNLYNNSIIIMLTLYFSPTCPFCQRVMQMAENLKIELDLKDVTTDESIKAELVEIQGGSEVPYMVDTDNNKVIDESNDIIEYMRENYAGSGSTDTPAKPRIHVGGSVCESCEG